MMEDRQERKRQRKRKREREKEERKIMDKFLVFINTNKGQQIKLTCCLGQFEQSEK